MPEINERRTSPAGETRQWSGTRWEPVDVHPVSDQEPDTWWGGALKGASQYVGEQKGKMTALGGLLGGLAGAPSIGAGLGRTAADMAERAGDPGGQHSPGLGEALVHGAETGVGAWAGGKMLSGLGSLLGKTSGAADLALKAGSHVPGLKTASTAAMALKAGVGNRGSQMLQGLKDYLGQDLAEATPSSLNPISAFRAPAPPPGVVPSLPSGDWAAAERPWAGNVSPKGGSSGGGGIAAPGASSPPRPTLSKPVAPYTQGPEVMPNLIKGGELATPVPPGYVPGARPDLSRTPSMSHAAEVVEPPADWHGSNLSQSSPTDPDLDWQEYLGRTNPRRASTSGYDYSASTPATRRQELGLGELKNLDPAPPADPDFGPNTVGAAQRKGSKLPSGRIGSSSLPQSVEEGKGLTLQEQEGWERYKMDNPGVTDAQLDAWYRFTGGGADPNAGKTIPAAINELLNLTKRPR